MPFLSEALHNSKKVHTSIHKRSNYNVTYHHKRVSTANVLGNRVSESKPNLKPQICQDEMHKMMSCWKNHGFKEGVCGKELELFDACVQQAKADAAERKKTLDTQELGQTYKLNPKQVNKLLKMYPEPSYKLTITHDHGRKKKHPTVVTGVIRDHAFRK